MLHSVAQLLGHADPVCCRQAVRVGTLSVQVGLPLEKVVLVSTACHHAVIYLMVVVNRLCKYFMVRNVMIIINKDSMHYVCDIKEAEVYEELLDLVDGFMGTEITEGFMYASVPLFLKRLGRLWC